MPTQTPQQPIETFHATNNGRPRRLFTPKKFVERHSDHNTDSSFRDLMFHAKTRHSTKGEVPGNGMLDFRVIIRIGRKILIDEDAYFQWLDAQQESGGAMTLDHSKEIVDPEGELNATQTGTKEPKGAMTLRHSKEITDPDGIKPDATLTGTIRRDHGQ